VRRELSNLLSIGILKSEANNNRLYYEVNQDYDFYRPLSMIFGGVVDNMATSSAKQAATAPKTAGKAKTAADVVPEHPLAKAVRGTGRVDLAILTGQFTRDDTAGVDVLLVGDLNQAKVARFISELEKAENKELRYVVMALKDLNYRAQIHDRFISNILAAKKQVIINSQELPINQ
jgi:hypothetical protein